MTDRQQAREILKAAPCRVLLPAGCGKTHTVVCVAREAAAFGKRILVLTHTNAGVDAIRRRLKRLDVSQTDIKVRTIASWTRALALAYPRCSGYTETDAESVGFDAACTSAIAAMKNPHVAAMLRHSYDYLVVDEYQDCTSSQHAVVRVLEDIIGPLMVFGDPLQAIYDFGDSRLIEWDTDLIDLPEVAPDVIPWRWEKTNPKLGRYLLDVRDCLIDGTYVAFNDNAIRWVKDAPEARVNTMLSMAGAAGSVVILDKFENQCEAIARRLKGRFHVMEDLAGTKATRTAARIDQGDAPKAAAAILELAKASFAGLPGPLTSKLEKLQAGGPMPAFKRDGKSGEVLQALADVASEISPLCVAVLMDAISALPTATLFRREAWTDLRNATTAWQQGASSLSDALQARQTRKRAAGRGLPARTVTRPVLVKGQEFDHAIVLAKDGIDRRDLYVALTRASTSVTVISPNQGVEVV